MIHEGPYNDIQNWQYHRLPEVFGGGWSCEVRTEGELEAALGRAGSERGAQLLKGASEYLAPAHEELLQQREQRRRSRRR